MCYHIIRWYDSVRAGPAIKRCYRTRQQAHLDKDTRVGSVTGRISTWSRTIRPRASSTP